MPDSSKNSNVIGRLHLTGWIVVAAGLGAMAAFLLDPVSGRNRRARVRTRGVRAARGAWTYASRRAFDLGHRLRGRIHELNREWRSEVEVDDDTLLQRIRSHMGHEIRHSRSVCVEADRGEVTLSGVVAATDLDRLVACVERVPGVRSVLDRLEVQEGSVH